MKKQTDCLCPIWQTPAAKQSEDFGRMQLYASPRAGGNFVVAAPYDDWARELDDFGKAALTTWILNSNRSGETPKIELRKLKDIASRRRLLPSERADRLLEYLAKAQAHLGEQLTFSPTWDPEQYLLAHAWAECVSKDELHFLLDELISRGLLAGGEIGHDDYSLRVTLAGHNRVAELAFANQNSVQVFVAMWFDESMTTAYENGFDEAIRRAGYRPLRIDRKETIDKIDDEIIAEIRRSRFVVADFTSERLRPRGGVYFEAGFAMGLNIPVIWTCRADLVEELHFDTRQFSHIVWQDPEELRLKLYNRIGAVIGHGPLATTK